MTIINLGPNSQPVDLNDEKYSPKTELIKSVIFPFPFLPSPKKITKWCSKFNPIIHVDTYVNKYSL